jgi:ubiquinone/menaquinone biosynthesis C-methylase UbiE
MKREETIRQFYEKYHSANTVIPIDEFKQSERCNYLRFLLKNVQGKVLIIGCGSKDDMSIINDKCKGVGIDISAEAIKKSKKKYPRFKYFVADATNLPFPTSSFDCVVCSEVIEHVPEEEKVLLEAKRVLKNGGVFIITTPNWLSWYGLARKIAEKLLKRPFTAADQPIDNWSTPFSLRNKLLMYGYQIILFSGHWYYPPTGKGNKQISSQIVFPMVKLLYPLETLFRKLFPWFGHWILFKTYLEKSNQK